MIVTFWAWIKLKFMLPFCSGFRRSYFDSGRRKYVFQDLKVKIMAHMRTENKERYK